VVLQTRLNVCVYRLCTCSVPTPITLPRQNISIYPLKDCFRSDTHTATTQNGKKKSHLWSQHCHISHSAVRQAWANGECLRQFKQSRLCKQFSKNVCVDVLFNKIQQQMTSFSLSLSLSCCRAGRAPPHGRVKDYCVHPLLQKVSVHVHVVYLKANICGFLHHWDGLQTSALL